jgi:hypothetical protein
MKSASLGLLLMGPKDRQLNLPPTLLPNREQESVLLPKQEQAPKVSAGEADASAARLFDEALTAAQLSSQEAAHLLGCSESLVNKMRSPNARERVSLAHLLLLTPRFHLELHRALNRRFGFGRQLLRRIVDDLGDLALAMER